VAAGHSLPQGLASSFAWRAAAMAGALAAVKTCPFVFGKTYVNVSRD